MTREEKIAELINIRDNFNYTLAPREVFDDAIEVLKQEPILDNATNGDMIKAMFPNVEITYHNDNIELYNKNSISAEVLYQWWNSPYNPPKQNLTPADKSGLEYADQPTLQSAT